MKIEINCYNVTKEHAWSDKVYTPVKYILDTKKAGEFIIPRSNGKNWIGWTKQTFVRLGTKDEALTQLDKIKEMMGDTARSCDLKVHSGYKRYGVIFIDNK